MTVYTAASTRRSFSPWGMEVKKRLVDRRMIQEDLVSALRNQGFEIDKQTLSNLLYGLGSTNRQGEIEAISRLLDIPYRGAPGKGCDPDLSPAHSGVTCPGA